MSDSPKSSGSLDVHASSTPKKSPVLPIEEVILKTQTSLASKTAPFKFSSTATPSTSWFANPSIRLPTAATSGSSGPGPSFTTPSKASLTSDPSSNIPKNATEERTLTPTYNFDTEKSITLLVGSKQHKMTVHACQIIGSSGFFATTLGENLSQYTVELPNETTDLRFEDADT